MNRRSFTLLTLAAATVLAVPRLFAQTASAPAFTFDSIDGGSYDTADWRGKPVLIVNTASMCGFAPQYNDLQQLSDTLGDKVVVLTVPSDDFNQELGSDAEVKEYCAINFDLSLPMTTITAVAKGKVHPFYAWVKTQTDFTPGWNFNKVLLDQNGQIVRSWGASAKPMGAIKEAMEGLLG